jgi:DNA-binding MarR family transcriptional regulator
VTARKARAAAAPEHAAADIAPLVAQASRGTMGLMMARLTARGFEGLTPAFAQLMPLLDAAGARSTDLARQAGVSKQAMSQLVRELQARGYVEQLADPADERAKIVRLTRCGIALRKACFEVRQEIQTLIGRKLGKTRLASLERGLAELAAALAAAKG